MEQEFSSQSEFVNHLIDLWDDRLSPEQVRDFAGRIAKSVAEPRLPPARRGAAPLRVPVVRWVIKDDDIKLIDAIFDGLKAGVAAGLIHGVPATAAVTTTVVAVAATVFKLGRQAMRKGRKLTILEYQILTALSACPEGLTTEYLTSYLELMAHQKVEEITVQRTIKGLQSIALSDGTVTSLVSQDAAGILRAAGV